MLDVIKDLTDQVKIIVTKKEYYVNYETSKDKKILILFPRYYLKFYKLIYLIITFSIFN